MIRIETRSGMKKWTVERDRARKGWGISVSQNVRHAPLVRDIRMLGRMLGRCGACPRRETKRSIGWRRCADSPRRCGRATWKHGSKSRNCCRHWMWAQSGHWRPHFRSSSAFRTWRSPTIGFAGGDSGRWEMKRPSTARMRRCSARCGTLGSQRIISTKPSVVLVSTSFSPPTPLRQPGAPSFRSTGGWPLC